MERVHERAGARNERLRSKINEGLTARERGTELNQGLVTGADITFYIT